MTENQTTNLTHLGVSQIQKHLKAAMSALDAAGEADLADQVKAIFKQVAARPAVDYVRASTVKVETIPIDACICDGKVAKPRANCWATTHNLKVKP